MAFFEDFYNKSLEVFKKESKKLGDSPSEFDQNWSTPGNLTALGFGHEQYNFYFDYAFGEHPDKSLWININPVSDSHDIDEYCFDSYNEDDWPCDEEEIGEFENFVKNIAIAKAVFSLIKDDSLNMKILETTQIDIFDDIDDDFSFMKFIFTEKISDDIKK